MRDLQMHATIYFISIIVLTIVLMTLIIRHRRKAATCKLTIPLGQMSFDCYVINMPQDTRRMKGFIDSYKHSDLADDHSLIRHEAVVGKHVRIAEYTTPKALCEILQAEKNSYRQKHYELTRGGIGCWLSHKRLWEKVLMSDKKCAIIFEDDCIMARNIKGLLDDATIPEDWDICLLGYYCNSCDQTECSDALEVSRFFGLHCYMIRDQGIQKILSNPKMNFIEKQIDSVLSDMILDGELNVYALPEPIAWQNNRDYKTTIQMHLKKIKGVDEWE